MKNIVLARVDDRLIHTEILTLWVPEVRAIVRAARFKQQHGGIRIFSQTGSENVAG